MPHYEARMNSDGGIVIPDEIRASLALNDGDTVDFYVDPGTRAVRILARNAKLVDLAGSLKSAPPVVPLSQSGIDDAIGDHLAEKHERISREWNERREFEEWKKAKAAE